MIWDWRSFALGVAAGLMLAWAGNARAHCAALDPNCVPACNDGGDSNCSVEPWSHEKSCDWLSKNPRKEHTAFAFIQTLHCAELGGKLSGGLFDRYCASTRGIFAGAPYLPAIFGNQTIGHLARQCSAASGVPAELLVTNMDPQNHESVSYTHLTLPTKA